MHQQLTPGTRTIWKLPIEIVDEPQVLGGAGLRRILHFGEQRGLLFVWCEVVIGGPEQTIVVQVVGTGQEVPPDWKYVGSVQVSVWVWHLFQEPQGD